MAKIDSLKISSLEHRLKNILPRIGIRPVIDGRLGGVRESLEKQTMEMARSAARLLSEELRHPCGLPVECVIADTCIGGVAENGLIHLINSGSAALDGTGRQSRDGKPVIKPFWEVTAAEVGKCLDATMWREASLGYFRGGGYSSDFLTRGGMEVTMSRINLAKGLGPVLQIAEGYTVDLEEDVHDTLDNRTDPTWPTTWFAPILTGKDAFRDVYSVMANWGANHGAISYGHIGADLIALASMLRIPVCMHNVAAEAVYRPSVWSIFGMDQEGSDYRACAVYGPLYG